MGEILGAVFLAGDQSLLNTTLRIEPIKVYAEGVESEDGQTVIDEKQGKLVSVLDSVDAEAYYRILANQLGAEKQSAVLASFEEQKRMWRKPLKSNLNSDIKQR